jgi:hypothetical protein
VPTKIEALAQLSRAEPTFEHFREFFEQVEAEKNDRGAALMLAANVELALTSIVRRTLVIKKGEDKRLFRFEAPLGSFEAKIRIGYALDIFGPETKSNLDLIKALRNVFAHAVIPLGFNTPQVKDVCDLLVMPDILPPRAINSKTGKPVTFLPTDATPRIRFQRVCEATGHNLFVWDWPISRESRSRQPKDGRVTVVLPQPLP